MLGAMTVLVLVEIALWNTLNVTTLIADEYSAYGLAAIIFLGAGYTLKENGHIKITLVTTFLPRRGSACLNLLACAITTSFMGYLLWHLYRMTAATFRYSSTSGTLTETPLWIPQTVMLAGAVSFFLQLVSETLQSGQDVMKNSDA
jgi:TRAP-type C4-dicarboxylate transport system permease small subunit